MKRYTLILILSILFAINFSVQVVATESTYAEDIQSNIQSELSDIIDKDVKEVLEEIGLTDFSFNEIYNISFSKITSFFAETMREKAESALKDFTELLAVVLLLGIVGAFFKDYSDENFISILCSVVVTLFAVNIVKDSIGSMVSVLQSSGKFMLGFAPIYTLIISLSGNTASALTYNTVAVFIAEFVSSVISFISVDLIGLYFCLGISFSMNENINLSRFTSVVGRVVSIGLGLIASTFTGFLSLKNILSVSVDRVSVRSIRFLISSLIPIVGSSISDAYSSLLGSINLIKSSIAIVGILVIVIINTPIIIETLTYYLAFNFLSYTADILSANKTGDIFRVFSCGIRILLLLSVFEMFILIITTGIMLSVKGGG